MSFTIRPHRRFPVCCPASYYALLFTLLLAATIDVTPALAVLSADDVLRIQMQMKQMSQVSKQGQLLDDSQIVRLSRGSEML